MQDIATATYFRQQFPDCEILFPLERSLNNYPTMSAFYAALLKEECGNINTLCKVFGKSATFEDLKCLWLFCALEAAARFADDGECRLLVERLIRCRLGGCGSRSWQKYSGKAENLLRKRAAELDKIDAQQNVARIKLRKFRGTSYKSANAQRVICKLHNLKKARKQATVNLITAKITLQTARGGGSPKKLLVQMREIARCGFLDDPRERDGELVVLASLRSIGNIFDGR